MACGDREALSRIATGTTSPPYPPPARAQAHLALGDRAAALAIYREQPPDPVVDLDVILNDDWTWRLPHALNFAHLQLASGDAGGEATLRRVLAAVDRVEAEGIASAEPSIWAAAALHLLGRTDEARLRLTEARRRGWRHDWWLAIDWNFDVAVLRGDGRLADATGR